MTIPLNFWEMIRVHSSDENNECIFDDFEEIHTMYKDYHGDMVDFYNYIGNSFWLSFRVSRYDKSLINGSDKISEVIPQLSSFSKNLYKSFIAEKTVLSSQIEPEVKNVKYDLGFSKTISFLDKDVFSRVEVSLQDNKHNKRYLAFNEKLTSFLIEKYEDDNFNIISVDNTYKAEENLLFCYLYSLNESDKTTKEQKNIIFDYLIKSKNFISLPVQVSYSEITSFLRDKKKQVFSSLLTDKEFEVYLIDKNEDVSFYLNLINELLVS